MKKYFNSFHNCEFFGKPKMVPLYGITVKTLFHTPPLFIKSVLNHKYDITYAK